MHPVAELHVVVNLRVWCAAVVAQRAATAAASSLSTTARRVGAVAIFVRLVARGFGLGIEVEPDWAESRQTGTDDGHGELDVGPIEYWGSVVYETKVEVLAMLSSCSWSCVQCRRRENTYK